MNCYALLGGVDWEHIDPTTLFNWFYFVANYTRAPQALLKWHNHSKTDSDKDYLWNTLLIK